MMKMLQVVAEVKYSFELHVEPIKKKPMKTSQFTYRRYQWYSQ